MKTLLISQIFLCCLLLPCLSQASELMDPAIYVEGISMNIRRYKDTDCLKHRIMYDVYVAYEYVQSDANNPNFVIRHINPYTRAVTKVFSFDLIGNNKYRIIDTDETTVVHGVKNGIYYMDTTTVPGEDYDYIYVTYSLNITKSDKKVIKNFVRSQKGMKDVSIDFEYAKIKHQRCYAC